MEHDEQPVTDSPIGIEGEKPKKSRLPLYIAIVAAVLLLGCCIVFVKPNFYAGGVSIERVVLSNEFDPDSDPGPSMSRFNSRDTIYCTVWTKGADVIIGARWYFEDQLVYEKFERTENNQITTGIQPPLMAGNYRVDISLSSGNPLRSINFIVDEKEMAVVPPQPTPPGHIDLENDTLHLSIPFAFDEVWSIDGRDWEINEVKIVYLQDVPALVAVAIDNSEELSNYTEAEARTIAEPILDYLLANGYYDTARALEVEGENLDFENIFITLFNPNLGGGYRVDFEVSELEFPDN